MPQEQTQVPITLFLGLTFNSLLRTSIDELRRDTLRRSPVFRLCRGGGISPVFDTYVVVVVVAVAVTDPGCAAVDRLLLLLLVVPDDDL